MPKFREVHPHFTNEEAASCLIAHLGKRWSKNLNHVLILKGTFFPTSKLSCSLYTHIFFPNKKYVILACIHLFKAPHTKAIFEDEKH